MSERKGAEMPILIANPPQSGDIIVYQRFGTGIAGFGKQYRTQARTQKKSVRRETF
jgi:hypothetical protein